MQYQDSGEEPIAKARQSLPISQESGGAMVFSPPSALQSLDSLISKEQSPDKIKEILILKDIALKQQWQENQILESKKQQDYERRSRDQKEKTITITSSGTVIIGLIMMYSLSPLVGTFVLLLGLATLLRIPFDDLYDKFLEFFDKIHERFSSLFSS